MSVLRDYELWSIDKLNVELRVSGKKRDLIEMYFWDELYAYYPCMELISKALHCSCTLYFFLLAI